MFISDYCCWVNEGVWRAWIAGRQEAFADCGRASAATLYALMGDDDQALAIAEPLAERYFEFLPWAADPQFQGVYRTLPAGSEEDTCDGH